MERKNRKFTRQEELEYDDLGNGVRRKVLAYGDAMMQVLVEFEKGAVGSLHSHPHVQLTYVLEGAFEFNIGGEIQIVRKGDTLYKTPNVEHGCVCLEKGILLDTFTPMREEFVK
jgi:quercetin dioxygenase-like cupin family protein